MQPTILLVEDNPDDEALTLRALQKGKVKTEIVVVRDGKEALDYLLYEGSYSERLKGNPQLILLDLQLPKVDGLEVLRILRKNESTKYIPVVLLTSMEDEKALMAGYSGGANSFVVKPLDIEQFTKAVQQLHLYWIVLNDGPSRT